LAFFPLPLALGTSTASSFVFFPLPFPFVGFSSISSSSSLAAFPFPFPFPLDPLASPFSSLATNNYYCIIISKFLKTILIWISKVHIKCLLNFKHKVNSQVSIEQVFNKHNVYSVAFMQ